MNISVGWKSAAVGIGVLAGCGSDSRSPVAPATGSIEIVMTSIGADLDPDGYMVSAGGKSASVVSNGTATIEIEPGLVPIRIEGLASNCFLTTPDTVTKEVVASFTTRVELTADCFPRWSRLLYLAMAPQRTLVIFDPFEKTKSLITPALPYYTDPSWSSDGAQILFSGTHKPPAPVIGGGLAILDLDIYRINLDGGALSRLTSSANYEMEPSASSDGTRIVYVKLNSTDTNIWSMEADGSNQRSLTQTSGRSEVSPRWAPGNDWIVFSAANSTESKLERMRSDGSERQTLSAPQVGYYFRPSWSPDGSRIAFSGALSGTTARRIFVMNADGTNVVPVVQTGPDDTYPSWSRNGRWILFTRTTGGQSDLYMAPVSGDALVRLTSDGATRGSWRP